MKEIREGKQYKTATIMLNSNRAENGTDIERNLYHSTLHTLPAAPSALKELPCGR